jgi:hypothetical protein
MSITPAQHTLLLRLARSPAFCRGEDADTAKRLVEQGLASIDAQGQSPPYYGITPAGRRYIALNHAAGRRASQQPIVLNDGEGTSIPSMSGAIVTVADMRRAGWKVISMCEACGFVMPVDLELVAWQSGPRTVLRERSAPCKSIGCGGRMRFQVRVAGGETYWALGAQPAP